nr:fibroin heavy chain-like [Ziziphus jujuba var. spinosa]
MCKRVWQEAFQGAGPRTGQQVGPGVEALDWVLGQHEAIPWEGHGAGTKAGLGAGQGLGMELVVELEKELDKRLGEGLEAVQGAGRRVGPGVEALDWVLGRHEAIPWEGHGAGPRTGQEAGQVTGRGAGHGARHGAREGAGQDAGRGAGQGAGLGAVGVNCAHEQHKANYNPMASGDVQEVWLEAGQGDGPRTSQRGGPLAEGLDWVLGQHEAIPWEGHGAGHGAGQVVGPGAGQEARHGARHGAREGAGQDAGSIAVNFGWTAWNQPKDDPAHWSEDLQEHEAIPWEGHGAGNGAGTEVGPGVGQGARHGARDGTGQNAGQGAGQGAGLGAVGLDCALGQHEDLLDPIIEDVVVGATHILNMCTMLEKAKQCKKTNQATIAMLSKMSSKEGRLLQILAGLPKNQPEDGLAHWPGDVQRVGPRVEGLDWVLERHEAIPWERHGASCRAGLEAGQGTGQGAGHGALHGAREGAGQDLGEGLGKELG